ncbi:MAG TPA: glycosyltransferase family 2 protein [Hymenobacter sp.]|uniref:glycosyltransferase family 2 protein n=1 Tax=Hymenobacter sp. TaxID=1898978 RepID=UPI002ED8829E
MSIIIPSFNQAQELRGLLETIDTQSFRDFEVLIVDGCSDESVKWVVNDFTQLPIQFVSEPDNGIYDAMNKGIDRSVGEYLYFIGCDDRLAGPDVLAKVFSDQYNLKYDYLYGNVIFTLDNSVYDGKFTRLKLLSKNICHQSIFVHRKVFANIGKFNIRYKYLADWVFNMECFSTPTIKKKHIEVVVAFYNNAGSSFSFPDHNFVEDREMLERRFFPKRIRYMHLKLTYFTEYFVRVKRYLKRKIA